MAGSIRRALATVWNFRSTILLFALPLVGLPLLLIDDKAAKCGWVVLVMAGYWTFEVVPIAVTAFLPIILFPLLGIQDSGDVAPNYFKDTIFLVMGGLIVAIAVQHWNLHRRIALKVLLIVGTQARWLMLGFMCTTAFLSMWISNTATTAMMVPIVNSILRQMYNKRTDAMDTTNYENIAVTNMDEEGSEVHEKRPNPTQNTDNVTTNDVISDQPLGYGSFHLCDDDQTATTFPGKHVTNETTPIISADDEADAWFASLSADERSVCKGMLLSIAYAASFGGMGALTGTAANIVLVGLIEGLYKVEPITFASWFFFALPGMFLNLLLGWCLLQVVYLRKSCRDCTSRRRCCSTDGGGAVYSAIKNQYEELGSMTWAEGWVFVHLIVLALLWITRTLSFVPGGMGWASLFPESGYIADATAAMFIAFSLFVFPSKKPDMFCWQDSVKPGPRPALITWHVVQKNMAWNVIVLVGGGFALADGCQVSGLSQWLADQLVILKDIPPPVTVIIVTITICLLTEVTSNVATANIFLPVLAALAESICVNPLYILVPATFSCSFAFMLPVATPPNAIIFSCGMVSVTDMIKSGIFMNIICVVILNVMINTLGIPLFDVHTYPDWAAVSNSTCLLDMQ